MAGRNVYDIDSDQKEILEHRAKRRQILRQQYLQELHNPYRIASQHGGAVNDVMISRYNAMRASFSEFFKPSPKNSAFFLLVTVLPVIGFTYMLKVTRDAREATFRRGEVSYRDREYKFK